MNYKNPVIFDFEATSKDPWEAEIIQVAMLAPLTNEKLEIKLKFDVDAANKEALEMNSYNEEAWKAEAVDSLEAIEKFIGFLEQHKSIDCVSRRGNPFQVAAGMGYNVIRYDNILLARWFEKHSKFLPMDYRLYDVMQLAQWLEPSLSSYKLVDIAAGMDIKREDAHDAMADVEMTADVAAVLLNSIFQGPPKWVGRRLRMIERRKNNG